MAEWIEDQAQKALWAAVEALPPETALQQAVMILTTRDGDTALVVAGSSEELRDSDAVIDALFSNLKIALERRGIDLSAFVMRAGQG